MSFFEIGPNDSLYYEYEPPSGNQALTFVFINAITGDTGMWQAEIGPTLRVASLSPDKYWQFLLLQLNIAMNLCVLNTE